MIPLPYAIFEKSTAGWEWRKQTQKPVRTEQNIIFTVDQDNDKVTEPGGVELPLLTSHRIPGYSRAGLNLQRN